MSYIGEYRETPFLQHTNEGDAYLREFKVVKAFPALRNAITRTAYGPQGAGSGQGSVVDACRNMGRGSASSASSVRLEARREVEGRERQQQPPTSKSIVESLAKSIVVGVAGKGTGAMSEFHGALIREKLAAKKALLAKERAGLRSTAKAEAKAKLLNDPDATARVLAKLEYFAADFDADKTFARVLLRGFTGRKMKPTEFREQLRRSLSLKLSMEEVMALMDHFDDNGDGYIECREFILHFFAAAFKRRSEVRSEELDKIYRVEKAARDAKRAAEEAEAERNFAILKTPFDEEDLRRGVGELTHLAHWWDFASYRDKIFLEPFSCSEMTPLQFQEQLLHSFKLKTRDAEMAALCKFFDTNGDGTVDGPEFLRGFFKMQQNFHAAVADRTNYDNDRHAENMAAVYDERPKPSTVTEPNRLRRPQHTGQKRFDATGGHPMGRPSVTTLEGLRRAKQMNEKGMLGSGLGGEKRARVPKSAPAPVRRSLGTGDVSRDVSPMRSEGGSRQESPVRGRTPLHTVEDSLQSQPLSRLVNDGGHRSKLRESKSLEQLEQGLSSIAGFSGNAEVDQPMTAASRRQSSMPGPLTKPAGVDRTSILVALAHGNDFASHDKGTVTLFGRGSPSKPKTLSGIDALLRRQGDNASGKKGPRRRSMKDGGMDRFGRPVLSAEKLRELQLRLKGAMYGSDPRKWLARYDKDKGGSLDAAEFQKIVRGHMRLGRKDLSDDDLQAFIHTLDVDGGGDVSLKEIMEFLKPDPAKAAKANEAASTIQGLIRRKQAWEKVKERREIVNAATPEG